jgi:hypothetical protein
MLTPQGAACSVSAAQLLRAKIHEILAALYQADRLPNSMSVAGWTPTSFAACFLGSLNAASNRPHQE